ncbi:MAG: cupredoxin domain-containing protein [Chloroflexota bacterium]|nr:cupredoxin domain-containing protein [Chloroflexota bacterium]
MSRPTVSRARAARAVILFSVLAALVIACAGAPPAAPAGTPAATVEIAADNLAFDRNMLTVPADAPFAIRFENRESAPHNVSIHRNGPLFTGEIFSGPAERIYQVPALAAGEYQFICDVHPDMRGTLVSQ